MRKLKIFEHISLDGVLQVRGSGEDGDYPYGDWTEPYRSPAGREAALAASTGIVINAYQAAGPLKNQP